MKPGHVEYIELDDREQAAEAARQYVSAVMEADALHSGLLQAGHGYEEVRCFIGQFAREADALKWMEALRP